MSIAVVLLLGGSTQAEVVIETVTVGNPGNAGENSGESEPGGYGPDRVCGAVNYVFHIGTFEVTAGQYREFLNAVASTDPYGLYNMSMSDPSGSSSGCNIQRSGSPGSYTYNVAGDWADRPVNYVSWGDAARLANWLHNGQPTGAQAPGTTETGSYFLDGAMSEAELSAVAREPDATWVIPTEDEWYKAAYHQNDGVTGNYFDYPTQSNTAPTAEAPPGTDMTNGSAAYIGEGFVDPTYHRTEVGTYDARPSDSAYGTFDQAGNVSEWNEAVILGLYRGVRGGSFDYAEQIQLHASYRKYNSPAIEYYNLGFRVAKVSGLGPADVDGDGDLDLGDFASFQGQFTGDLFDFVSLHARFTGPR